MKNITRKDIQFMINWCSQKFGISRFALYPALYINRTERKFYGQYNPYKNRIQINLKKHKSLIHLCGTIIHEYTHYLQDMEKYNVYLYEFNRTYSNHPYEVTAQHREIKYSKELKSAFTKWKKK